MYEFADDSLESLQPAQKQLVRMGPANTKRIKSKLSGGGQGTEKCSKQWLVSLMAKPLANIRVLDLSIVRASRLQ